METIECKDCHKPFTLSEEEKAYFSRTIIDKFTGNEMTLKPPKRCKDCRKKKHAIREQESSGIAIHIGGEKSPGEE